MRVYLASEQILRVLDVKASTLEAARKASIGYALGFADKDRILLRLDYLPKSRDYLKYEIAKKIHISAKEFRNEYGDEKVGDILSMIYKMLANKPQTIDEEEYMAASTIIAMDMVDRVCWKGISWNPVGAYSLLKRLKFGAHNIHPNVLTCVVGLLCEALTNHPVPLLVSERCYYLLKRKANGGSKLCVPNYNSQKETLISVSELQPGMKVSKPVILYDGQLVLGGGIKLDEDLIWRIWELASIKPIEGVVIAKD